MSKTFAQTRSAVCERRKWMALLWKSNTSLEKAYIFAKIIRLKMPQMNGIGKQIWQIRSLWERTYRYHSLSAYDSRGMWGEAGDKLLGQPSLSFSYKSKLTSIEILSLDRRSISRTDPPIQVSNRCAHSVEDNELNRERDRRRDQWQHWHYYHVCQMGSTPYKSLGRRILPIILDGSRVPIKYDG